MGSMGSIVRLEALATDFHHRPDITQPSPTPNPSPITAPPTITNPKLPFITSSQSWQPLHSPWKSPKTPVLLTIKPAQISHLGCHNRVHGYQQPDFLLRVLVSIMYSLGTCSSRVCSSNNSIKIIHFQLHSIFRACRTRPLINRPLKNYRAKKGLY